MTNEKTNILFMKFSFDKYEEINRWLKLVHKYLPWYACISLFMVDHIKDSHRVDICRVTDRGKEYTIMLIFINVSLF